MSQPNMTLIQERISEDLNDLNKSNLSPALRAVANYLNVDVPAPENQVHANQAEVERVFMKALEPILDALQLNPQTKQDKHRVERAIEQVRNLQGILDGTNTQHGGFELPAITNVEQMN